MWFPASHCLLHCSLSGLHSEVLRTENGVPEARHLAIEGSLAHHKAGELGCLTPWAEEALEGRKVLPSLVDGHRSKRLHKTDQEQQGLCCKAYSAEVGTLNLIL